MLMRTSDVLAVPLLSLECRGSLSAYPLRAPRAVTRSRRGQIFIATYRSSLLRTLLFSHLRDAVHRFPTLYSRYYNARGHTWHTRLLAVHRDRPRAHRCLHAVIIYDRSFVTANYEARYILRTIENYIRARTFHSPSTSVPIRDLSYARSLDISGRNRESDNRTDLRYRGETSQGLFGRHLVRIVFANVITDRREWAQNAKGEKPRRFAEW